jgi:hypothetical protein
MIFLEDELLEGEKEQEAAQKIEGHQPDLSHLMPYALAYRHQAHPFRSRASPRAVVSSAA